MLASYSRFQLVSVMWLESAMTKAGICTLSTVNLPAPVNSTVVPSSMKMVRAMSVPILTFTGQSTVNVNAPWLAAAKAVATPAVSSDVPLHVTHALIDFLVTVLEAGVDVVAAAVVAGLVAVTVVAVVGAGVAGVEDLATVTVVGIVAVGAGATTATVVPA